jgi:hypothetical protein
MNEVVSVGTAYLVLTRLIIPDNNKMMKEPLFIGSSNMYEGKIPLDSVTCVKR